MNIVKDYIKTNQPEGLLFIQPNRSLVSIVILKRYLPSIEEGDKLFHDFPLHKIRLSKCNNYKGKRVFLYGKNYYMISLGYRYIPYSFQDLLLDKEFFELEVVDSLNNEVSLVLIDE